jgi:hypothetical protein
LTRCVIVEYSYGRERHLCRNETSQVTLVAYKHDNGIRGATTFQEASQVLLELIDRVQHAAVVDDEGSVSAAIE